jgi:hypothetical protein
MKEDVGLTAAIRIGTLWVNIPVFALIFGAFGISIALAGIEAVQHNRQIWFGIAGLLIGCALGWMWWSFALPRWRAWAYEHVNDIEELKRRAVRASLIWPEGHIFERTEFRTKSLQRSLDASCQKARRTAP